jgi:hypothetical protein
MVPSDHDDAKASALRFRDRLDGFGPWRVDHPDDPGEDKLALDRFVLGRGLGGVERAVRDCQRAKRVVGERVDRRMDARPTLVRQRLVARTHPVRACIVPGALEELLW